MSDLQPINTRFAKVYGSPGEAPRVLGLLRAFWPLLGVCFVSGYLFRAGFPFPSLSISQVGILFFLVAVASAYFLARGSRRLGHFLKGARGEEWVARRLVFLSSDYVVFNSFRLKQGKQNFDHIVIGPPGIFVVETKNWRGSVTFQDGKLLAGGKEPSRPPLRQVKAATAELVEYFDQAGLPEIPIHSVLCFVSTELPEEIMNINGVVVCKGDRLFDVLHETFDAPVDPKIREQAVAALKNSPTST
jgi:hypothetical protein